MTNNNNSEAFSVTGRIRSIRHAIDGICEMLMGQHNARVHVIVTISVVSIGAFFQISTTEWCCLTLAIISVWVAEAFNTAFEFLCDVASPEFHPLGMEIK
jgi:diacylglycerol kinase (ATP)